MRFLEKLFGKTPKKNTENTDFDKLSENEKLEAVAKLIEVGAKDGNAEEQYNLAMMFSTGKGPYGNGSHMKDLKEARKWFEKSAMQNYVPSIVELAMMYGMGEGGEANLKKAHELFMKAAIQNDPFSQYMVGVNFFYGKGVKENFDEAAQWYIKAAENGEHHAQVELGMIFEMGGDIESAKRWYKKAAAQGNADAKQKLKDI